MTYEQQMDIMRAIGRHVAEEHLSLFRKYAKALTKENTMEDETKIQSYTTPAITIDRACVLTVKHEPQVGDVYRLPNSTTEWTLCKRRESTHWGPGWDVVSNSGSHAFFNYTAEMMRALFVRHDKEMVPTKSLPPCGHVMCAKQGDGTCLYTTPAPAQHPSDAKRSATCALNGKPNYSPCGDAGPMMGVSRVPSSPSSISGSFGLCAVHYLEREKAIANGTAHGGRLIIRGIGRKPLRPEPYERLHSHLQVACLPKGVNPEGWERR